MANVPDGQHVPEFIRQAIKMRLTQESEKLITEAKQELEKRTPGIVTSVVVDLMNMVEFSDSRERIVFTIRKN